MKKTVTLFFNHNMYLPKNINCETETNTLKDSLEELSARHNYMYCKNIISM